MRSSASILSMVTGTSALYGIGSSAGSTCISTFTAYSNSGGAPLWQRPYAPCAQGFLGGLAHFPWVVPG